MVCFHTESVAPKYPKQTAEVLPWSQWALRSAHRWEEKIVCNTNWRHVYINSRIRQDAQGFSWSKRRFFFNLAVISYANSTCKVKKVKDIDDSCPQNFFHSGSYVRFCHQDLRRYFIFPYLSLWGSCQGKLYCSRDISKTQTIKFFRGKLPWKKSVILKKSTGSQVFPSR